MEFYVGQIATKMQGEVLIVLAVTSCLWFLRQRAGQEGGNIVPAKRNAEGVLVAPFLFFIRRTAGAARKGRGGPRSTTRPLQYRRLVMAVLPVLVLPVPSRQTRLTTTTALLLPAAPLLGG